MPQNWSGFWRRRFGSEAPREKPLPLPSAAAPETTPLPALEAAPDEHSGDEVPAAPVFHTEAAPVFEPKAAPVMLNDAITAMLDRLNTYLPAAPAAPAPAPSVSLVRVEEKPVGLGNQSGEDRTRFFPITKKGLRLSATTRFQIWGAQPAPVEQQVAAISQQLLADREELVTRGFLELKLRDVTLVDHVSAVSSWRQTAEFDLLFEHEFEDSDLAGGLIVRIPIELREQFGGMIVSGDLAIWNSDGAPALSAARRRGTITGLASLELLPSAPPAGSVTVTRTFDGAVGAPVAFPDLANFAAAITGPAPSRHAQVVFASLGAFLGDIGATGAPAIFVDETDAERPFPSRSILFSSPLQMQSPSDRFEIDFGGAALGAGQIVYLRVMRGQPSA
ncbi:MAG: hypothetical protein R2729_19435 [Bryobacteraceae bacterium]